MKEKPKKGLRRTVAACLRLGAFALALGAAGGAWADTCRVIGSEVTIGSATQSSGGYRWENNQSTMTITFTTPDGCAAGDTLLFSKLQMVSAGDDNANYTGAYGRRLSIVVDGVTYTSGWAVLTSSSAIGTLTGQNVLTYNFPNVPVLAGGSYTLTLLDRPSGKTGVRYAVTNTGSIIYVTSASDTYKPIAIATVTPVKTSAPEVGSTLLFANTTAIGNVSTSGAGECNLNLAIPYSTTLLPGTVVCVKKVNLASWNDAFVDWDTTNHKSDPYFIKVNNVKSLSLQGTTTDPGSAPAISLTNATIQANATTSLNRLSFEYSATCELTVGESYQAATGNNASTGVALLYRNGNLCYGSNNDQAGVRYVESTTPSILSSAAASGAYPVYEMYAEVVSVPAYTFNVESGETTSISAINTAAAVAAENDDDLFVVIASGSTVNIDAAPASNVKFYGAFNVTDGQIVTANGVTVNVKNGGKVRVPYTDVATAFASIEDGAMLYLTGEENVATAGTMPVTLPTGANGGAINTTVIRRDGGYCVGTWNGADAYTYNSTINTAICGASTVFDATFTNINTYAYKSVSNLGTGSDSGKYSYNNSFADKTTGIMLYHDWYTSGTFMSDATSAAMTLVVVGQMPSAKNTFFLSIGGSNTGFSALVFATTEKDNEVLVARSYENTVYPITTMTVPNAATVRHVYAITKEDKTIDAAEKSVFTVYLDGTKWKTLIVDKITLNQGGVQVGAEFHGALRDGQAVDSEGNTVYLYKAYGRDTTGYVNAIRFFSSVLDESTIAKFSTSEEYPYESPYGNSIRTFTADGNWVETSTTPWEDTQAGGVASSSGSPLDGSSLTVKSDNASGVTVSVNLDEDKTYEALTLTGDPIAFEFAAGKTGVIKATGAITIGAETTIKAGALEVGGATTILDNGKAKLIFDYSDYDASGVTVANPQTTPLVLASMDEQAEGMVTCTVPTTPHRAYSFGYANGGYNLSIVAKQVTFHRPSPDVTVDLDTLEGAMESALSGDVITLNEDVTISELTIPAGVEVVLDGKALTVTTLTVNGTLTGTPTLTDGATVSVATPLVVTALGDYTCAEGTVVDSAYSGEGVKFMPLASAVASVGGQYYSSVASAISATADTDATITLRADDSTAVTLSGQTIDENGNTFTGTLSGNGKIVLSALRTSEMSFGEWTGTVVLPQVTSAPQGGFRFDYYGKAGSSIDVSNGFYGWISTSTANAYQIKSTILVYDNSFTVNGTNSGTWYQIAKLSGTCNFSLIQSNAPSGFHILVLEDYSGTISNTIGSGTPTALTISRLNLASAPVAGQRLVSTTTPNAVDVESVYVGNEQQTVTLAKGTDGIYVAAASVTKGNATTYYATAALAMAAAGTDAATITLFCATDSDISLAADQILDTNGFDVGEVTTSATDSYVTQVGNVYSVAAKKAVTLEVGENVEFTGSVANGDKFIPGETFTVSATPAQYYSASITVDGATEEDGTVTVGDSDITVTVSATRNRVNVTIPTVLHATIEALTPSEGDYQVAGQTPDGITVSVFAGSKLTITWSAQDGYILADETTEVDVGSEAVTVSGAGLAQPAKIVARFYASAEATESTPYAALFDGNTGALIALAQALYSPVSTAYVLVVDSTVETPNEYGSSNIGYSETDCKYARAVTKIDNGTATYPAFLNLADAWEAAGKGADTATITVVSDPSDSVTIAADQKLKVIAGAVDLSDNVSFAEGIKTSTATEEGVTTYTAREWYSWTVTVVAENATVTGFTSPVSEASPDITFNVAAAATYKVTSVKVNNVEVGTTAGDYNATLTGDTTITVATALDVVTFTVVVPANTVVTVDGDDYTADFQLTKSIGSEVTITYTASGAYVGESKSQTVTVGAETASVSAPAEYVIVPAVAQVGTIYFATFAEALAAAEGKTLKLLADLELTSTVTIDKSMTLNLNGFDVTATDCRAFHVTAGTVAFTGTGTVSATADGNVNASTFPNSSSVIRVGSDTAVTSFTLGENVRVESDYCYGVTYFGVKRQTVTINGTVAVTGVQAAISGNGSAKYNTSEGGTTLTVNGTVTATQDYAIYNPQTGTTAINGTVSGLGGIEVKAGTLTVGATAEITATATTQSHSTNNDGTSTVGYAIASVGNANYQGEPAVTIAGGTIAGQAVVLADQESAENGTITATSDQIAAPADYKWVETATAGVYELVEKEYVAEVDGQDYETFAEALAAAEGKTLTLLANLALTSTVTIDKSMTLNLNGFDVTATDCRAFHVTAGTVAFTGTGTVSATADGNVNASTFPNSSSVIRVGSDTAVTSFTLGENVRVESDYCYGVTYFGVKRQTVTINGTVAVTGVQAAISGNGSAKYNTSEGGTTLTVNGTVTATQDYAIYNPQTGTTAINGTVSGLGGIEVKAGTLTVGATAEITATATTQSHSTNNDGTSTSGYVIAAIGNPAYVGEPVVVVTGGEIAGTLTALSDTGAEDPGATIAVSGGTFDAEVPVEYCADSFIPEDNGDGTYGVAAGWKITWNVDGVKTVTCVADGDEITVPTEEPTKTGHDFAGWIDENNDPFVAGTRATEDAEYRAHFTSNSGVEIELPEAEEGEASVTRIVSVPGAGLTAATLIKTDGRPANEDLILKAYDTVNSTYYSWKYNGTAWDTVGTVALNGNGEQTNVAIPDASAYSLAAGQGVWVTYDPLVNLVLNGTYATGAATVRVESGWNLVAPVPTAAATTKIAVNEVVQKDQNTSGDKILVPASASSAPIVLDCQYNSESGEYEWGYDFIETYEDNGKTRTRKVRKTDVTVPAGTGFWYISAADKEITL